MAHRAEPYPEILDPAEWDVREPITAYDRPETDTAAKRMIVPMGDTEYEYQIRQHEMAHVKWTPPDGMAQAKRRGLNTEILMAIEDGRLGILQGSAGMDPTIGHELQYREIIDKIERTKNISINDKIKLIACLVLSQGATAHFSGLADYAARKFNPETQGYFYGAIQEGAVHGHGELPNFNATLQATRNLMNYLQQEAENIKKAAKTPTTYSAHGHGGSGEGQYEKSELEDAARRLMKNPLTDSDEGGRIEGGRIPELNIPSGKSPPPGDVYDRWGKMHIKEPTRPIAGRKRGLRKKKWRHKEEGYIPIRTDRWATDKKIWGLPRAFPGGSILIDHSGSMCLSAEEVYSIVQLLPGSLIAMYSGSNTYGDLTILAKGGRIVKEEECLHSLGGNTIDGPALYWLSAQKGPRIWISDAGVHGTNPNVSAQLFRDECALICKKFRILRLPTVPDAINYLKMNMKGR